MIVRWVKVDANEYVSNWQGKRLVLMYSRKDGKWRLTVDNKPVRQTWHALRVAQEHIDTVQSRILQYLIAQNNPADQGPPSKVFTAQKQRNLTIH